MKKIIFIVLAFAPISLLLTSCSGIKTGTFGKRKYTSGIFHNKKAGANVLKKAKELASVSSNDLNKENVSDVKSSESEVKLITKNSHAKAVAKSTFKSREKMTQLATNTDKSNSFSKASKPFFINPFKNVRGTSASKNFGIEETNKPKADQVIEIILAIFLPAIGVYVHEGVTTNFWIALILWLLWPIASIFAVLVVLDIIDLG